MTEAPAPAPTWVDTHVHLDSAVFDQDRERVLASARAAGVRAMVNIGFHPPSWERTLALAASEPDVGVVLGLHPGHADELNDENWALLERLAGAFGLLAVGEAGLDFHYDGPPRDTQVAAFREQIRLAVRLDKPLVIHQRQAERELIDVLLAEPAMPRLILHSFDGSERYAAFAREVGAMVGVGGLATKSASGPLRAVLATIPVERILLETDAPYLIPRGARGRFNMSGNIPIIARHVAPIWQCSAEELAMTTTNNAVRVLGPALARLLDASSAD